MFTYIRLPRMSSHPRDEYIWRVLAFQVTIEVVDRVLEHVWSLRDPKGSNNNCGRYFPQFMRFEIEHRAKVMHEIGNWDSRHLERRDETHKNEGSENVVFNNGQI